MIYNLENIDDYFKNFNIAKLPKKSKKNIKYYNMPCTFDIETTSCYIDKITNEAIESNKIAIKKEKDGNNFDSDRYQKAAFMYVWQLSINDFIIMGRTWEEYELVMDKIHSYFKLGTQRNIIIYVRNLSFEFQFLRSHHYFSKVFATEARKVIYAITDGFTFRCSYFLSGCSLETTGKNLVKYKAEKKVGDLDYDKIRTYKTPLNDEEIGYCVNDVIVDSNYIREQMEKEKGGSILKLPLTKTGYVRRTVKNYCLDKMTKLEYQKILYRMPLDKKRYEQLKRAFSGGFTHANALNSGTTFENVKSFDFTSSYPSVLLLEKYPMGKGYPVEIYNINYFYKLLTIYACIFDIEYTNIRMKENVYENIISESKCFVKENAEINNGRIVSASKISITINEVDYRAINCFYDYDAIKISNMITYKKDYLPKSLIEIILKFYEDKTKLKDIEEYKIEYDLAKSNLNSCYGMMVTDIVRDTINFDENEWTISMDDTDECLNKYNKAKSRFLSYEWGVWCTSYARRNLYTGILELERDYIYSDTDSVKFTNLEKHKSYFELYNKIIDDKIKKVCDYYQLNIESFKPKTIKGIVKTIGVWDDDGFYKRFKTLGAKRYMVEYTDEEYQKKLKKDPKAKKISITVSGINKKIAVPYIIENCKKLNMDPFDYFSEDMYIDSENCGKMTHSYIDTEFRGEIKDYTGIAADVIEKSAVHLENSPYSLSIVEEYKRYINKIKLKAKRGY